MKVQILLMHLAVLMMSSRSRHSASLPVVRGSVVCLVILNMTSSWGYQSALRSCRESLEMKSLKWYLSSHFLQKEERQMKLTCCQHETKKFMAFAGAQGHPFSPVIEYFLVCILCLSINCFTFVSCM